MILAWPAPDAAALRLCREAGAEFVITPLGDGHAPAHEAGLRLVAEAAAAPAAMERARVAGYDGVAVTAAGSEAEFRKFIEAQKGFVQFVYVKPDQLGWDVAPARAVLRGGMWPGVQQGSLGEAGATERPWLNGNLHLYAYMRAMHPSREAVLSFAADDKPARYEGAEIALAEAFAGGGSVVLALPEMYRTGLLTGGARALAAWKRLGKVAAFLKQQAGVRRAGGGARLAVVAGALDEQTEEVLNLAYRNNLSPEVLRAGDAERIRRFGQDGRMVVTIPETVLDPSEFARDLKEKVGLANPAGRGLSGLDLRVWNASTVLGTLHRGEGVKVVVLVSYGRWMDQDFLVGLRGDYSGGVMAQPEGAERRLELMRRGGRVELNLKGLERVAVITLKEKAK
ncbi:MAG: hypothetical protein HY858_08050 [Candidatus Solibacter usitatus]|nr:hypothetical protein [Candidatus Solibacter usitatus]